MTFDIEIFMEIFREFKNLVKVVQNIGHFTRGPKYVLLLVASDIKSP